MKHLGKGELLIIILSGMVVIIMTGVHKGFIKLNSKELELKKQSNLLNSNKTKSKKDDKSNDFQDNELKNISIKLDNILNRLSMLENKVKSTTEKKQIAGEKVLPLNYFPRFPINHLGTFNNSMEQQLPSFGSPYVRSSPMAQTSSRNDVIDHLLSNNNNVIFNRQFPEKPFIQGPGQKLETIPYNGFRGRMPGPPIMMPLFRRRLFLPPGQINNNVADRILPVRKPLFDMSRNTEMEDKGEIPIPLRKQLINLTRNNELDEFSEISSFDESTDSHKFGFPINIISNPLNHKDKPSVINDNIVLNQLNNKDTPNKIKVLGNVTSPFNKMYGNKNLTTSDKSQENKNLATFDKSQENNNLATSDKSQEKNNTLTNSDKSQEKNNTLTNSDKSHEKNNTLTNSDKSEEKNDLTKNKDDDDNDNANMNEKEGLPDVVRISIFDNSENANKFTESIKNNTKPTYEGMEKSAVLSMDSVKEMDKLKPQFDNHDPKAIEKAKEIFEMGIDPKVIEKFNKMEEMREKSQNEETKNSNKNKKKIEEKIGKLEDEGVKINGKNKNDSKDKTRDILKEESEDLQRQMTEEDNSKGKSDEEFEKKATNDEKNKEEEEIGKDFLDEKSIKQLQRENKIQNETSNNTEIKVKNENSTGINQKKECEDPENCKTKEYNLEKNRSSSSEETSEISPIIHDILNVEKNNEILKHKNIMD